MRAITFWARWAAVLPGSILAGLLMTLPMHWILYTTLSQYFDPVPEFPERAISPLVIGATVVWAGARIAPTRPMETAVVLFGLWTLLLGGFAALTLSGAGFAGGQLYFQAGGLASVMAFVGGFVGLLIARNEVSQRAESHHGYGE